MRQQNKAAACPVVSPREAYALLMKRFGPQGWWPVTLPGQRIPRYRPGDYRRTAAEGFEICTGAILTQNTAWKNVEKALFNLQGENAVSVDKLCRMPVEKIARCIMPSGYYNQKAERLKGIAGYLFRNYGTALDGFFSRPRNVLRKELLSLKGIGPETADSILLYAGNKRSFVVDAYTNRVGQRLGWFGEDGYDAVQRFFQRMLPSSSKVYNEFHALIVALCKEHCRKKPVCENCPLAKRCARGRKYA